MVNKARQGTSPLFLFVTLPFTAAFLLGTQHEDVLAGIFHNPAASDVPSDFLAISLIVCAITLAVVSQLARWRMWTSGSSLLLACIFLLIVGLGLYVMQVYFYPETEYLAALSAVLVGISGGLMMLLWGKALSMINSRSLTIYLSASFVITGILSIVSKMVFAQMDLTIVAISYVLISTFPLLWLFDKGDSPEDTIYDVFPKRRRVAAATAKSFAGVAICLVITACIWGDVFGVLADYKGTSLYVCRMIGITVGSGVLLVAKLVASDKRGYPMFISMAPAISAGLLVVSWFTMLPWTALYAISNFLFGAACGMLFVIGLRELARICHEHDSALAVFGEVGMGLYAIMLVVLFAAQLSSIFCIVVLSVLIFAYLILVNINPGYTLGEDEVEEPPVRREIEYPDNVEEAFDWLAYIGGLNSAEREILPLLARGHGSDYIASALSMSYDTVQKRTRDIYSRLGVRHRAELVQLVRWHV